MSDVHYTEDIKTAIYINRIVYIPNIQYKRQFVIMHIDNKHVV